MGNHRHLWAIIGNHRQLWAIMGNYGQLWTIIGNYGQFVKSFCKVDPMLNLCDDPQA